MKIERQINGGKFNAEGVMIEPAAIIISFTELTLDDYKETSLKLSKHFKIDPPESILRRFHKVVIAGDTHQIHEGGNPTIGRLNDLVGSSG